MGPVARQVDHKAIQSILCCAYNHSYICDFNTLYKRFQGEVFRVEYLLLIRMNADSQRARAYENVHAKDNDN